MTTKTLPRFLHYTRLVLRSQQRCLAASYFSSLLVPLCKRPHTTLYDSYLRPEPWHIKIFLWDSTIKVQDFRKQQQHIYYVSGVKKVAEQFEMIFRDFVTFVLFTGCSNETKFVRILQNEILFLLSHLVNSLIKSKTLQQLAKKHLLTQNQSCFT